MVYYQLWCILFEFREAVAYSISCAKKTLHARPSRRKLFSICTMVGMCSRCFLLGTGVNLVPNTKLCLQYISRLKQLHSTSGDSGQIVFSNVNHNA